MRSRVFHDRGAAGELLGVAVGAEVAAAELVAPVVLGLPRGGIPVAAKVAEAIYAPLDALFVRKLGVPAQPELAMGAIGEGGVVVVNHHVVALAHLDQNVLSRIEARERVELERRLAHVRSHRPRQSIVDRSAIIVDDGIATGATIRAAVLVARASGARDVTVATPVAPADVVDLLETEADRVVCLEQPEPFGSVGRWYRHFGPVSDAEVLELLTAAFTADRP